MNVICQPVPSTFSEMTGKWDQDIIATARLASYECGLLQVQECIHTGNNANVKKDMAERSLLPAGSHRLGKA